MASVFLAAAVVSTLWMTYYGLTRAEAAAMRAEWWRGFEVAGRVLAAGGLHAAPPHLLPPALAVLHRDGGLGVACQEAARATRLDTPRPGLVARDVRAVHALSLVRSRKVPTEADAWVLIGFAQGLAGAEA